MTVAPARSAPPQGLRWLEPGGRARPLRLGAPLGRGGEAIVYAVEGRRDLAAKIYHRDDPQRNAKVAAMAARPVPGEETAGGRGGGHVTLAWPRALVTDGSGRPVGALLPRIDARRTRPLHQLYHPASRRRSAPGTDHRHLLRIARNLCRVVANLHDAGVVVGDLNESNALVDDRSLVTLIDLDSVQLRADGKLYPCPVGKPEFTPPELHGRTLRDARRHPHHDRFALSVLVFLLLMEGTHPFAALHRGAGDPPSLAERIAARRSAFFGAGDPPPLAPPATVLTPELRRLLRRALLGRARRRPDARQLAAALERAEARTVACSRAPHHRHGVHLRACPWCARRERLGTDPFPPGPSGRRATGLERPSPTPSTSSAPGGSAPSAVVLVRRRPFATAAVTAVGVVAGAALGTFAWQLLVTVGGSGPVRWLGAFIAAGVPALGLSAAVLARSRRSARLRRALELLERALRAALGAGVVAAIIALVASRLVTGVWRPAAEGTLPALAGWILAFGALWRLLPVPPDDAAHDSRAGPATSARGSGR